AKNPQVGFIGAEAFLNGVASLIQLIDQKQLTNVLIFSGDGRKLFRIIPDQSLAKTIVLFPDPWPKLRHHKRRLLNQAVLKEIARVLQSGGELRIASDHQGYVQWALNQIKQIPQFVPQFSLDKVPTSRPLDWEPTRYESKALTSDNPCYYLSYYNQ